MQSERVKASLSSAQVRSLLEAHLGDAMRIIEVLGSNGLDYLMRARHRDLGDDVFVRAFAEDPAGDPGAFRAFMAMAETTAALEHPNITAARPLQRHGQLAYFIIPSAGASTLESLLEDGKLLPIDRSLAILRDIASALDHAHASGVIHARLEPSAIRIRENGAAVVTGFGVGSGIPLSHAGRSAAYMAPEQWERHATVNGRVDIYALGVIAFEMLAGRRRAIALSAEGIAIVDPLPVTRDTSLRSGVGLHVNEALLRAVAKRSGLRFATAGELVAMLEGRSQPQVHGLPTQRPALEIDHASRFALIPIVFVVGLGVALGVTAAPMARQALGQPSDFVSITDGIDLSHALTASGSIAPAGPSASHSASGGTMNNSNPSGSGGLFPGAATAAGGGAAGRASPPSAPASTSPPPASQSSSPGANTITPGASFGGSQPSSGARENAQPAASDSLGFVRVELQGASALVLIDGVPRGRSPYVGQLGAGTHSVSVVSTSPVQPSNRQIVVRQGDTTVASFAVSPATPR